MPDHVLGAAAREPAFAALLGLSHPIAPGALLAAAAHHWGPRLLARLDADVPPAPKPAPAPAAPEAPATVATLRIDSDVPGAQVFIDREFIGSTPVTASNVTSAGLNSR